LADFLAAALGWPYLAKLLFDQIMQQVYTVVFNPLQVATQVGFLLAEGVVPLRTFLGL
jgi:hypothetical protein